MNSTKIYIYIYIQIYGQIDTTVRPWYCHQSTKSDFTTDDDVTLFSGWHSHALAKFVTFVVLGSKKLRQRLSRISECITEIWLLLSFPLKNLLG